MRTFVKLYSKKNGEIIRFLNKFYLEEFYDKNQILEWKKTYENPIEMAEIVGVFIDNIDEFDINMWICLDEEILINVTKNNVNDLIKYLYERFPY